MQDREILEAVAIGELVKEDAFILLKANKIMKKLMDSKKNATKPVGAKIMLHTEEKSMGNQVKDRLLAILSRILYLREQDIHDDEQFADMGVDSISGVEIIRDINQEFQLHLDVTVLYDYGTLQKLAQLIKSMSEKPAVSQTSFPKAASRTKEKKSSNKIVLPSAGTKQNPIEMEEVVLQEQSVQEHVVEIIKKNLHMTEQPDIMCSLYDLGADSISGVEIVRDLNQRFGLKMDVALLYDYSTISKISQYISSMVNTAGSEESKKKIKIDTMDEVAIVGISCQFPGAKNMYQYWENIRNGVDSVTEIPRKRWDADLLYSEDIHEEGKTYSKKGGYLEDIEMFDSLFFNISPLEAETMDPQQRIFLQEAWKALENAGYTQEFLDGQKCGVYVGGGSGDYSKKLEEAGKGLSAEAFTGTAGSILASRISYFLNLKGPSITFDTACSSSLVAIHEACAAIQRGAINMAIAGGVELMVTPELHVRSSKMGIISKSGKCSTFDQSADGTIISEGIGIVILKSLRDAIRDKDFIYGVVEGIGINQDGKTNGITAPSALSQEMLETEVYIGNGIHPENIDLIEAHGTGTPIGDPIEVNALTKAFRKFTNKEEFCLLGSVKPNIGHTTAAAGVAGVIKVLLAIMHKELPPSIHFQTLNPYIHLEHSPFYIQTECTPWIKDNGNEPRRAAVSAFGFSGTNAHIVIREHCTV